MTLQLAKISQKKRDFMWVIFILLLQVSFLTFIITVRANTHQNLWRTFSVISLLTKALQGFGAPGWPLEPNVYGGIHELLKCCYRFFPSNAWYQFYITMFTWPRPEADEFAAIDFID